MSAMQQHKFEHNSYRLYEYRNTLTTLMAMYLTEIFTERLASLMNKCAIDKEVMHGTDTEARPSNTCIAALAHLQ